MKLCIFNFNMFYREGEVNRKRHKVDGSKYPSNTSPLRDKAEKGDKYSDRRHEKHQTTEITRQSHAKEDKCDNQDLESDHDYKSNKSEKKIKSKRHKHQSISKAKEELVLTQSKDCVDQEDAYHGEKISKQKYYKQDNIKKPDKYKTEREEQSKKNSVSTEFQIQEDDKKPKTRKGFEVKNKGIIHQ